MQERINKRRILSLVVLTIATALVYWWVKPGNELDVPQGVFRVDHLESIDAVRLASDTAAVRLAYNGTYWRVNDRYDADGDMIRVLFATLQQARPKRAVTNNDNDSLARALREEGIKVSLYRGDALAKEFYAGGNKAKTQAYFADPATDAVYVMHIPGYRVYVSGILELPRDAWRNKLVFGFNWRNFRDLEAEFPEKPGNNFRVSQRDRYFGIDGLANVDTARLNTFLDDVSLLTVDEYRSIPKLRDSLAQTVPQMEIRVTDVANRTYRLRLYEGRNRGRVLGLIGEDQPAVFSRQKVDAVLRPKSFFARK